MEPTGHPSLSSPTRAVLIYDGDCGFCRRSVHQLRGMTGDAIEFIPQQEDSCARRFPRLTPEALAAAVHLVEPDGTVSRGAEAVCRAVSRNPRYRWTLKVYQGVGPAAWLMERIYAWVARHRAFVSRLTRRWLPEEPAGKT